MKTIAITGGTGFIGQHLVKYFDRVHVLTRNPNKASAMFQTDEFRNTAIECFQWDPMCEAAPAVAFESVDAVIHLAGESVQGRWTNAKKKRINDSRVIGTRNLVAGLKALTTPPKTLIGCSGVGYYGDRGNEKIDEDFSAANDFLSKVCVNWEAEENRAKQSGLRVVNLRIGAVLGLGGGAIQAMLPPFKYGLGAKISTGKQYFSWIHIADVCRIIQFAIQHEEISGPVNVTSPHPVTNAEFTRAFAKQLRRPAFWPAPAWLVKLLFGEFSVEVLASKRVVPQVMIDAGFEFQFPELQPALTDLLAND